MSDSAIYYVMVNDQQQGPYTATELRNRVLSGTISPDTLIWKEDLPEWIRFCDHFGSQGTAIVHTNPAIPTRVAAPAIAPAYPAPFYVPAPKRSYPKWPWICFAISCLFWLSSAGWLATIEEEAQPLLNEMGRMNSTDYAQGVWVESFFRGLFGDPFGKVQEEYQKASGMQDRLGQLATDWQEANGATGFFFLLTLVFAGLWIWQHVRYKRRRLAGFN